MLRSLLLSSLLLPLSALAQNHAAVEFDPAQFEAQRQAIETELNTGTRYSEIGVAQKREVLASLDRIASLLARGVPVSQMSENDRIALFNAQEAVNQILTEAAEDSRLICRRETPVGSHRSTTVCRTVAQRRMAQEESRGYLQNQRRTEPLPRGN